MAGRGWWCGVLVAVGCAGPDALPASFGTAGSSGNAASTGRTDSPTRGGSTSTGFEDSSDDGTIFLILPDANVGGSNCSPWDDDCPVGEKCVPVTTGGGGWDAYRCVPIVRDPAQPGERCTIQDNPYSGLDTCAFHSTCWFVDPETLEGTCLSLCMGDSHHPLCKDSDTVCPQSGSGVINLCRPLCDAVAQDCPESLGCYPTNAGFVCVADASGDGGNVGDNCRFINDCKPGSVCVYPARAQGCDAGDGCCTSTCVVGDPDSPCPPGHTCEPWFSPDNAPTGQSLVGACQALP